FLYGSDPQRVAASSSKAGAHACLEPGGSRLHPETTKAGALYSQDENFAPTSYNIWLSKNLAFEFPSGRHCLGMIGLLVGRDWLRLFAQPLYAQPDRLAGAQIDGRLLAHAHA